jgi:hypothetical protein
MEDISDLENSHCEKKRILYPKYYCSSSLGVEFNLEDMAGMLLVTAYNS